MVLYVRRRRFSFHSPPLMNGVSDVRTARKGTVDRRTTLTVTLMPSLLFYTYLYLWSCNKTGSASQATFFHHFPYKSVRNSCLDSSVRHRAEHPHSIMRKIRARPPEIWGSLWNNVSYPCQVPYAHTHAHTTTYTNATTTQCMQVHCLHSHTHTNTQTDTHTHTLTCMWTCTTTTTITQCKLKCVAKVVFGDKYVNVLVGIWKIPTVQVAGDDHHQCKCSNCVS